jgi:hypothetical protein
VPKKKSIAHFKSTIKRSSELAFFHKALSKVLAANPQSPIPTGLCDDILRAAIVLSVAAMDAYFTDRFSEILVPYLKKNGATKDLTEILKDAGLDTKFALEILKMERPYRRIGSLIDGYFEKYTTQKYEVIDRLFLAYGIKDLCENAKNRSRKKKLLLRIENFVLRRHQVVHDGDCNMHGKLQKVSAKTVENRIRDIELFVENCDAILTNVV